MWARHSQHSCPVIIRGQPPACDPCVVTRTPVFPLAPSVNCQVWNITGGKTHLYNTMHQINPSNDNNQDPYGVWFQYHDTKTIFYPHSSIWLKDHEWMDNNSVTFFLVKFLWWQETKSTWQSNQTHCCSSIVRQVDLNERHWFHVGKWNNLWDLCLVRTQAACILGVFLHKSWFFGPQNTFLVLNTFQP